MVKMKLAVATPRVYLADVDKNYVQAVEMLERAAQEGAQMIVFPPHFLTGATCGVLSSQDLLSNAASKAFADISQLAAEKKMELVSESCSMPEMEIKCVSVLEMVTRYRKVKEKLAYLRRRAFPSMSYIEICHPFFYRHKALPPWSHLEGLHHELQ